MNWDLLTDIAQETTALMFLHQEHSLTTHGGKLIMNGTKLIGEYFPVSEVVRPSIVNASLKMDTSLIQRSNLLWEQPASHSRVPPPSPSHTLPGEHKHLKKEHEKQRARYCLV
jgi:hypothetical protein